MFPGIPVILCRERSTAVGEHERNQVNCHPALRLVCCNELVEVFQDLLA